MRITSRTIWALWAVPVVMVAITYSRLPPAELYHVSRSGLGGGLGRAVVYVDFPVSLVAIALVAVTYSSLGHRWEARLATVSMLLCACVVVPGIVDQDRLDARPLNAVPALGVLIAVVLTVRSRWPGVRCSGRQGVVAVCLGVLSLPWLAAEAGFYLPGGIFESGELVREPGEPGLVRAVHLGDHHGLSAVMLIVTALALWFAPRGHPRTFGRRATQAYLALMLSYGVVNAVQDFWGEQIAARGWTDWYIPDAVQPGATPIWVVIVLGAVLADRLPRSSVPHERANPLLRRFPNPPLRGGDVIVENGTHVITGVSRAPRYGLYAAGGGPTAMHIELTTTEPSKNWQDEANCLGVDPDLFFPERGASTREAKEVCRGCTVRLDCLEYALVNGEKFGIWGGLSERERRRLRRQRAQATRRTSA